MQNKILGGQGYENEKINQRTFGCSMCAFISSMADQETKRTAPRAVHHQKQQRLSILTLQMKSMHSE